MPDFLFDGPNLLIIEPAGVGNTTYDVQRDLYSAWKRWVLSGVGTGFPDAFTVEGGTPIGSTGLFTGTTYIMTNGWKVQAADHDHQLLLVGNIFSDDGVVIVPPPTAKTSVQIISSTTAQGIATGSGLTADQNTALLAARDHARAANVQTQPI
jgi:hypothetical protein